jgi:hypothetical protein
MSPGRSRRCERRQRRTAINTADRVQQRAARCCRAGRPESMVAGIAAGAVAWAPQPGRCGLGAAAWALRRRRAAHCRVQYYPSERSAVDTVQPGDFARTRCGRSRWMPILPRHTPPYVKRWQRSDRLARGGGAPQGREGPPHARHSRLENRTLVKRCWVAWLSTVGERSKEAEAAAGRGSENS